MRKSLSVFLTLMLVFSGCVSRGKLSGDGNETPEIRYRDEVAIGEEIHAEILSSYQVYTEPEVLAYVNRIARGLAEHSERKDLPYRITILYSEKVYATSAPGGFIYLTTGLLDYLDNEAELAAVIAHEIGSCNTAIPVFPRAENFGMPLPTGLLL